ncbi:MAG: DUF2975 domain-containing protein [Oscillospiraceae bacterium]|jgi:hypothetical protein
MVNKSLAKFTKRILDFMFWAGIVVTLAVPWVFRWAGEYFPNLKNYYVFHVILLMISGAAAVLIILELRRMFRTVLAEDCFVPENVRSLKRMGCLGLFIAAVTAARLFLVFTPATAVVIIVFFIASLFSFVLAGIFGEAVRYKQDNDLTI